MSFLALSAACMRFMFDQRLLGHLVASFLLQAQFVCVGISFYLLTLHVFFVHFLLVIMRLAVSTVNWLERLISKMLCEMSDMVTHSLEGI